MADVKISALPLASTPLAGTEVLPIVQSATTDQVSVANLTAGRSVSAASLTLTTTPLAVGSGGTGLSTLTAANNALYSTSSSALTAGTLPVAAGGTGLNTLASGRIPYGAGTSAFGNSANMQTDGNNLLIGGLTSSTGAFNRGVYVSSGANNIAGIQFTSTAQGTAFNSGFTVSLNSANASLVNYAAGFTAITNSTANPIYLQTNAGANTLTYDGSGNLGLGVTPSAWSSAYKVFDVGSIGSVANSTNVFGVFTNAYVNASSNYIYKNTNYATMYLQNAGGTGQHQWHIAPSGTAGNAISFTQAMTLDASGNLGVGTSSPGKRLDVAGGALRIRDNQLLLSIGTTQKAGFTTYDFISGSGADYSPTLYAETGLGMYFLVNGSVTKAMTLDASGNLLVGTTDSGPASGTGIKLTPAGDGAGAPKLNIVTSATTDAANYGIMYYSTGASAYRFYVGAGGTIFATSATITAISDRRLKENIVDLDVGLAALLTLKPRKFDWKSGKGKDIKGDRGWIADEFQQVFPDLIDEWKDTPPEGEEPYKAVRPDLMPVVVKAIQELAAKVTALEAANG